MSKMRSVRNALSFALFSRPAKAGLGRNPTLPRHLPLLSRYAGSLRDRAGLLSFAPYGARVIEDLNVFEHHTPGDVAMLRLRWMFRSLGFFCNL